MTSTPAATATIGLTGLAVMGRNLARNIARHGHPIAVHNRTTSRMTSLVEQFGDEGTFVGSESLGDFVASIQRPRAIIVMVKAGEGTDAVIDDLVPLLDEGDIVVDAGNAHFEDTRRREHALAGKGLHFVGMGVSGGEEGALDGPSIMVGGSDEAYERLGPILESIAAQVDGTPCCAHVGPDGAGHFVKMVHNGIEYADMQLIAEAYDVLRHLVGQEPAEIAEVFRAWNGGDLDSFLIEISAEVLAHVDAETGKPFVDVVADAAEQKGTGRWTVQSALDLGVPITGIAEATFARSISGHLAQRAGRPGGVRRAGRGPRPRGPARASSTTSARRCWPRRSSPTPRASTRSPPAATSTAGASTPARWPRSGAAAASSGRSSWTGSPSAYAAEPDLTTLLTQEYFATAVKEGADAWRRVVTAATGAGVPVPAFATSLSYFDALRRDRLPAALIQGLRDFFGAHTYQRTDREGTFHTKWAEEGRPEV